MRISTTAEIGEPIVEVALSAGCEQRFSRRFTIFADPPMVSAAKVASAQVPGGVTSAVPAAPAPLAGSALATRPVASAEAVKAPAGDRPRARHRKGPTMALANELNAPPVAAPARHAVVATPDVGSARKPGSRVAAAAPAAAPRLVLDGGYAHLKLDMDEPIMPAPAAASGAAVALTDLDDPDARQLRTLEQSIEAMKRSDQANRDQTAKLQAQLALAQAYDDWMPWLFGLLVLAVAAAAALGWKLRQQARYAHSAWFNESQLNTKTPPAPVLPEPPTVETPAPAVHVDASPSDSAEAALEPTGFHLSDSHSGGVVADVMATQAFDRSTLPAMQVPESAAPRELSVEELLDLEQQADFFIALGQEDAAVDLLMSHLRSAGGQSPLPYTKLLEIYRRQGDRSAYERTRARFNRRFNAYAPDWDTGPGAGRTLEDYPDTVALVQAAWASPIDAMAVLEGLLFKRDDTSELFDLPAYRDVLVLYSLARDLWQQGGGNASTQVDVLLPLDDSDYGSFQSQAPYPPARDIDELDLPLDVGGLPTSYEMSGFEPTGMASGVDLEIPSLADVRVEDHPANNGHDDGVHATLDALNLAPIETTRPPDRDPTDPPTGGSQPPRKH